MLVIGLTGGIGSGKTTVTEKFAALGVPIIDADEIAHELVRPGTPGLTELALQFGKQAINSSGELDRAWVRNRIFENPSEKKKLETILHPKIESEIILRVARTKADYCIVSIPLLIESGFRDLVDRILVVDAPENLQLERASSRDGVSSESIQTIIRSQCGRKERLAVADELIDNSGTEAFLDEQIEQAHRKFLALAAQ